MSFGAFSTKGMKFRPEVFTPAEIRSLMRATSSTGACGVRDRALIAVLFRGGLRVNECLSLSVRDLDLSSGALKVLHAKGGKERVVGLDETAVALVELWLARRAKLGIARTAPLFCTLKGTKLSRVHVTQGLKELAAKAGIDRRVHPHAMRHSRAVDLLRNGEDVVLIGEALGHASIATTTTYLKHLAPDAVVEAMRKGAW